MKVKILFLLALILVSVECTRIKRSPGDKETSLFGVVLGDQEFEGNSRINSKRDLPPQVSVNKTAKGFLPLPPDYNKLKIPLGSRIGNQSRSIFVMLDLSIREILTVDTNDEFLDLDTELQLIWIDWEIWEYLIQNKEAEKLLADGENEITLDAEFLKEIWKPDLFIEQMSGIDRTFLLSKLITLKFLVRHSDYSGAITFKSRQTFRVRCEMSFGYYPADTQSCPLRIRSYSYDERSLFLLWNPNQKIFLDQIEDPNYDMQVAEVEPGEKLFNVVTTSQSKCCAPKHYSTVQFIIKVRRNLKYHLTQTALPSVLLILITWLCFLIPPDMVEARIGVSMTTLLTMTAMFTSVRQQSPQVSYIMAIDIWMVVCILMLFFALVLFTVIYWMRRRLLQSQAMEEEAQKQEPGFRHVTIRRPSVDVEARPPQLKPVKVSSLYYDVVTHARRYSFALFSLVFIIFLISYSCWLMINSEYNDWEPSPKYNALPFENGTEDESVRLFKVESSTFDPNSKSDVIQNEFRFDKLFTIFVDPFTRNQVAVQNTAVEKIDDVEIETTTGFVSLNDSNVD